MSEVATTKRQRGKDADFGTLPTRFVPRFLDDADQRSAIVRAMKDRVQRLAVDVNADSVQKQTLVERAVFLTAILETQEVNSMEGTKDLDLGQYVQAVNSLQGVLRLLGFEKKAKAVGVSALVRQRYGEAKA